MDIIIGDFDLVMQEGSNSFSDRTDRGFRDFIISRCRNNFLTMRAPVVEMNELSFNDLIDDDIFLSVSSKMAAKGEVSGATDEAFGHSDSDILINRIRSFSGSAWMARRGTSFSWGFIRLFLREELFKKGYFSLREVLDKFLVFLFKMRESCFKIRDFNLGKVKDIFHFIDSFLEVISLVKDSSRGLALEVSAIFRRRARVFNDSDREIDGIIDTKISHLFSSNSPFRINWMLMSVSSSMRTL